MKRNESANNLWELIEYLWTFRVFTFKTCSKDSIAFLYAFISEYEEALSQIRSTFLGSIDIAIDITVNNT